MWRGQHPVGGPGPDPCPKPGAHTREGAGLWDAKTPLPIATSEHPLSGLLPSALATEQEVRSQPPPHTDGAPLCSLLADHSTMQPTAGVLRLRPAEDVCPRDLAFPRRRKRVVRSVLTSEAWSGDGGARRGTPELQRKATHQTRPGRDTRPRTTASHARPSHRTDPVGPLLFIFLDSLKRSFLPTDLSLQLFVDKTALIGRTRLRSDSLP